MIVWIIVMSKSLKTAGVIAGLWEVQEGKMRTRCNLKTICRDELQCSPYEPPSSKFCIGKKNPQKLYRNNSITPSRKLSVWYKW